MASKSNEPIPIPPSEGGSIMDVVTLSAAVVSVLAPFTPYLVEGGKKFAENAGDAAWKKAQVIWGKLTQHFGDDAKIKGKALSLSADPTDKDEQAALAKTLAARLNKEPKLAQEFMGLLGGPAGVQQVVADRSSWVKGILQDMTGNGLQAVNVSEDSVAENITQIKR
jgi:hypothetical protein